MARFGAIDITRVYAGALNNAFPLTRALCLPYLFESNGHLRHALDGEVGAAVLRGFERRGLVGLAIYGVFVLWAHAWLFGVSPRP